MPGKRQGESIQDSNDFSRGSIARNILKLALPMTMAQLINVMYSIVDRIYIGHIPHASAQALTGIGLCLPLLPSSRRLPTCSAWEGRLCARSPGEVMKKNGLKKLWEILSPCFFCQGAVLMLACFIFKSPSYICSGRATPHIHMQMNTLPCTCAAPLFVMTSLGMNNFINAQGFGRMGMLTVLLGAVLNIILDPILIFGFGMGVRGAAIATVISQGASALWVLQFLTGKGLC